MQSSTTSVKHRVAWGLSCGFHPATKLPFGDATTDGELIEHGSPVTLFFGVHGAEAGSPARASRLAEGSGRNTRVPRICSGVTEECNLYASMSCSQRNVRLSQCLMVRLSRLEHIHRRSASRLESCCSLSVALPFSTPIRPGQIALFGFKTQPFRTFAELNENLLKFRHVCQRRGDTTDNERESGQR